MILFDHQKSAIAHLQEWKVGALFMEAGTGKTRVACELLNATPDVDVVVWIGPLRTIKTEKNMPSIKDEISKWGGFYCDTFYFGVESIGLSDRIYLEVIGIISKAKKPFVIVDESIKIKNYSAKRTKRLLKIGEMTEYKLILNGTPISRNIIDIWCQMEFLSPKILNMSMSQFKRKFCYYTTIKKKTRWGGYIKKEFITGFENIDYLHSLIRHYVYECDLKLNISQNYSSWNYSITDEERDEYLAIRDKFLTDEMLEFRNNNIFLEMTQKMQHCYCCTPDKFATVDQIFETVPQSKTIIFCKYIDSQNECRKRYPDAMVLSYQKESLGLNLQDYCHTIYFDKVWDLALRVQSSRRTYRTGQEYDCKYYDLTGDVKLESLIDRNIEKKVGMTEYFKSVSNKQIKEDL